MTHVPANRAQALPSLLRLARGANRDALSAASQAQWYVSVWSSNQIPFAQQLTIPAPFLVPALFVQSWRYENSYRFYLTEFKEVASGNTTSYSQVRAPLEFAKDPARAMCSRAILLCWCAVAAGGQ